MRLIRLKRIKSTWSWWMYKCLSWTWLLTQAGSSRAIAQHHTDHCFVWWIRTTNSTWSVSWWMSPAGSQPHWDALQDVLDNCIKEILKTTSSLLMLLQLKVNSCCLMTDSWKAKVYDDQKPRYLEDFWREWYRSDGFITLCFGLWTCHSTANIILSIAERVLDIL